jgi:uncharacterized protein (TIGR00725 family)
MEEFPLAKSDKIRKPIIGVMGGADVSQSVSDMAFELGAAIAEKGWILLNGGRDVGVMRACSMGAKSKNGTVIGILPGNSKRDANPFVDIPIVTNMADARNLINVLSSDVVVACPGSAGTISEIALALKNDRSVVLCRFNCLKLFRSFENSGQLRFVERVSDCILCIESILNERAIAG